MAKKLEIAKQAVVSIEATQVQKMIHIIRGERVILDRDLAQLYGVETKNLKRQVKRNAARFPSDFMMELTRDEYNALRCQNGTIENGRGEHSKYLPFAFTENGVAMLSSVLTSEVAVQMELEVEKLRNYVEDILRDQNDTNELVGAQMEAINESLVELSVKVDLLSSKKSQPRNKIGF